MNENRIKFLSLTICLIAYGSVSFANIRGGSSEVNGPYFSGGDNSGGGYSLSRTVKKFGGGGNDPENRWTKFTELNLGEGSGESKFNH